jgi:hypothetical protein
MIESNKPNAGFAFPSERVSLRVTQHGTLPFIAGLLRWIGSSLGFVRSNLCG